MKTFVSKQEIKVPIKPAPAPEKQEYEVVLATENYVVFIGKSGTNEFINGDFSAYRPGDKISL